MRPGSEEQLERQLEKLRRIAEQEALDARLDLKHPKERLPSILWDPDKEFAILACCKLVQDSQEL